MRKRIFISILFLFAILGVYAQSDAVGINLQVMDNTSVDVRWNIKSSITPTKLDIYMRDNTSSSFTLYHSIPNPINNYWYLTTNVILSDFSFYFFVQVTDNQSKVYTSDTLSPIYIVLGGGSISQPHPTIRCSKYPLEAPDTLYLYRKYPYDPGFTRVYPIVESGTSFIDNTLAGVCNSEISYLVTNGANSSVSETKSATYTDTNPPDKPIIRGLTVDNNGDLVIRWHVSNDIDVEFYKIDTILPYGTWQNKDSVSGNTTSYVLMNDFCRFNSDFSVQYRVLAVDSCGNSTVWGIEELAFNPIILDVPYVHECNSVRFSWNNANCISGEISRYFIVSENHNTHSTDTIFINANNVSTQGDKNVFISNLNNFSGETSYTARLYVVNDQLPPDTVMTCPVDFYIGKVAAAPDTLTILSVNYDIATGNNLISIFVDAEPDENIEYILFTAPRPANGGNAKADTIARITPDQFPLSDGHITFRDNMQVTEPYTYYLVAKNDCGTSFIDSSYMQSIYLMGEENADAQMFRLCFSQSITNYKYDNIDYVIKREYSSSNNQTTNDDFAWQSCSGSPVGSSNFCSYCQTNSPTEIYNHCDNNIGFFYGDENFSITWYVTSEIKHFNGESHVSTSNPVTLYASVRMPNAFIPNAINEINRRFGPLNFFPNSPDTQAIDFQVFNSWGERIWHGTDISNDFYWDGKMMNDKDAPAGTYLYIYSITLNNGLQFKKQGSVNLIRK